MNLNVLQQDLEVQRYAFVEASAGTGKTFAIEHLVVRMVLAGVPIGRILVMTFTKAAKTELIRRIHQRLQLSLKVFLEVSPNASTDIPYLIPHRNSGEAARLLQAALQTFHEAKITTIHGFCQALLSKYAFEAEINMAFFESQSEQQRMENIRNYLQGHLQADYVSAAQLQIVLKGCGGKVATLFEKIGNRGMAASAEAPFDFTTLCSKINEALRSIGAVDKEKMAADFQMLGRHYNGLQSCADQCELLADWLGRGTALPAQVEEALQWKDFFWDLVISDRLNKTTLKKKEPLILHYPFLAQSLQKVMSPLLQAAKTPSCILDLLARGYQQFKTNFADRMETPDDLLYAMYKAVEKPRFFERVRNEFDAAVVDEFQDTDARQWAIFERLFVQRKLKALYLVGDPKQSIYAFRQADLYTYLRARDCFTSDERMHLAINYRAEKSLLRTLNTLFSHAPGWMPLPKIESALEVSPVTPAEKAEEDSLGAKEAADRRGSVHFLLIDSLSNQKGTFPHAEIHEKQLAPFLVDEILHLQEMKLFPLARMALLVKDRHQADALMSGLRKLGIRTVFVRSESIAASPVFQTVLALLRVLDAPHGLYELKRFLMSPIVKGSPDEMADALREGRLSEFLEQIHELKECYHSRGLGACLQKSLTLRLLDNATLLNRLLFYADVTFYEDFLQIQELLLEESSHGERSLSQLLAFLEEMYLKNSDENKPLQRHMQVVEDAAVVMTMHASKGLEFDVVFAVGLSLRSPHRDEQEPEEKDAEKMRLLYVAMTRAKRRLYVPLIIDKKQIPFKEGNASPAELFCARWSQPILTYSDWLKAGSSFTLEFLIENLQRLEKQCSLTWEILAERPVPSEVKKSREIRSLPLPRAFSPFWPKRESLSFSSLFRGADKAKPQLHAGAIAIDDLPLGTQTGNLIHAVMENLFRQGLHRPLARDKIRTLVEEMAMATVFENYIDPLLRMVLASLQLPLTPLQPGHPSFTLCEVSSSDLLPEMEFCYSHKTGLRKGFIDLFFMHEGLYYLVDWKTNWLSDYGPEERDEAMRQHGYRLQAALYVDALQRYVKLFDTRPFDSCFGGAHYLFLRGEKWESFMPEESLVL